MNEKKFNAAGRIVEIIPGCIVCKTCGFTAPDVFMVPEKSLTAEVLLREPSQDMIPTVLEAIKNCPENVIKFRKVEVK